MINKVIWNDNPISYKLVRVGCIDPFLHNVLCQPIFLLHNVHFGQLSCDNKSFTTLFRINSVHFSCLLLILLWSSSLHHCILSTLSFEQVSPLRCFRISLSKTLYIGFLTYILIILMPTIPICAFETSSLFNSYYHKEWPVYSWIYGSKNSTSIYREGFVEIFNSLSISWGSNPMHKH
jgi:hypothetical protein